MIKSKLFITFLAVTALTIASCSVDSDEPVPQQPKPVSLENQKSTNQSGRLIVSNLTLQVMSPNWNGDGTTCPDEELEIEVFGGVAPYNWTVQGATILRGQGTSTLFVKTSAAEQDVYLYFKATDIYGRSGSVSGRTDASSCRFFCDLYPNSALCGGGEGGGDGPVGEQK